MVFYIHQNILFNVFIDDSLQQNDTSLFDEDTYMEDISLNGIYIKYYTKYIESLFSTDSDDGQQALEDKTAYLKQAYTFHNLLYI